MGRVWGLAANRAVTALYPVQSTSGLSVWGLGFGVWGVELRSLGFVDYVWGLEFEG